MTTALYTPDEITADYQKEAKRNYLPDETYLNKLGFLKLEAATGREKCIYRFYNPSNNKGFDLIFSDDFGILTVEEFISDTATGRIFSCNTIVGMFHVESDEELKFIFSRNVRLNYVFNISRKRT